MPEPRYLMVGRVLRPHGLRGEVRAEIVTGYPERLSQHQTFLLAPAGSPERVRSYPVERIRLHESIMLLKLGGCDSREEAEQLRGMLVQVPIGEAVPLQEGEYFQFQLIGLRVETDAGQLLGQIAEILETGANDVYVVRGPLGEVLLPAVDEVVREIDVAAGRMLVHLLPGLLGEDEA